MKALSLTLKVVTAGLMIFGASIAQAASDLETYLKEEHHFELMIEKGKPGMRVLVHSKTFDSDEAFNLDKFEDGQINQTIQSGFTDLKPSQSPRSIFTDLTSQAQFNFANADVTSHPKFAAFSKEFRIHSACQSSDSFGLTKEACLAQAREILNK